MKTAFKVAGQISPKSHHFQGLLEHVLLPSWINFWPADFPLTHHMHI